MQKEYKGYLIVWLDVLRCFRLEQDGQRLNGRFETIAAAEAWIDKQVKKRFKRIPIFGRCGGWRDNVIREGFATSVVDSSTVWISDGKNRAKVSIGEVYVDDPENRKLFEQLKECERIRTEMDIKAREIKDTMRRITVEMLEGSNA